MAGTQLQTLCTMKSQLARPEGSPQETEAKKKIGKTKEFDFTAAAVSFYDSLCDEDERDAAFGLVRILADGEPDAEKVANEFIDTLNSEDSVKAEAAYRTLNHMIELYDLCTVPYVEDPLVNRMIDATKRYESNKKQAEARIAHELTHAYAALSNGG